MKRSRHLESGHGSLRSIYLGAVDGGYMKDLKEIRDEPNKKFDVDLATVSEKTRCIKFYGLLASLMRGRALQLVKAPG